MPNNKCACEEAGIIEVTTKYRGEDEPQKIHLCSDCAAKRIEELEHSVEQMKGWKLVSELERLGISYHVVKDKWVVIDSDGDGVRFNSLSEAVRAWADIRAAKN